MVRDLRAAAGRGYGARLEMRIRGDKLVETITDVLCFKL